MGDGPYLWFWSLLKVFGISATADDGRNISDVNPFEIAWRQSRWNLK